MRLINSKKKILSFLVGAYLTLNPINSISEEKQSDAIPPQKTVSSLREYMYGKSGDWLYEGLQGKSIPNSRKLKNDEKPFILDVDWRKQEKNNKEKLPLYDFTEVAYKTDSKANSALSIAFNVKDFKKGKELFDEYFKNNDKTRFLLDKQKQEIKEKESLIREKAAIFYISYSQDDVQLVYYPGIIQMKGGDRRSIERWLPNVPEEFKNGKRTDFKLVQDSTGLVALINGVFDKRDNFVKWKEKDGSIRFAGFGYDFEKYLAPQPEMGTVAIYDDGKIKIGTYSNLPNKDKIKTFVQNKFMVIENGVLAKDSNPNSFCSYHDNIARSYLFIDKNNRIGYIWTMYAPANVLAPIALEMGVKDMILLDIHAPISYSISNNDSELKYKSYKDYLARSYDFVPNFFKKKGISYSATLMSKVINSRIQTHYAFEAFEYGHEDYFCLFLKNSPEAKRIQSFQASANKSNK